MTGNAWDAGAYDATFGFVARYGDDVLALLDPQPGERILDLGCGTGHHAADIAAAGAHVVGLDADSGMLDKARTDHPDIDFVAADARAFTIDDLPGSGLFDACFSNAALHWMTPQRPVLDCVRRVLAPEARFVAEMGGQHNIAGLDASLRGALADLGVEDAPVAANYFPALGQEAALLEACGFRVEHAQWFRRPTPLGEGVTAAAWTQHFRADTWRAVPSGRHDELAAAVDRRARDLGLCVAGTWIADYCRLRFVAFAV